ncbi:MAG: acyl-protein synthetase [Gammaproteobacteria bacterium]|jgi:phenylacetate-coenzyme A ligase PaaK-like adenylate-forming protein|nr:acyl-protein synthetase [Gammaproteobacteria bacterium]
MLLEQLNAPFEMNQDQKQQVLFAELLALTDHHQAHCFYYQNLVENIFVQKHFKQNEDLPFLPAQIFKYLPLKSIREEEVFRVLNSSGTTGQQPSQIFLDKAAATHQAKVLSSIVTNFIGKKRLPMLIVDHPSAVKSAGMTARAAAILGFSSFGAQHTYLLSDEDLSLQVAALQAFLEKFPQQPILMFGFTFMIWAYLYEYCQKNNIFLDLSQVILVHGGGWKKLANLNIGKETFKQCLAAQFNLTKVHDYYGMVEQIGTIFMECEFGKMHIPFFADVLIRDPIHFQALGVNQTGLIQVLSILPKSYPGHSILTEDLGKITEIDECLCGRKGKVIEIHGRLPKAEARGCSDTHQR